MAAVPRRLLVGIERRRRRLARSHAPATRRHPLSRSALKRRRPVLSAVLNFNGVRTAIFNGQLVRSGSSLGAYTIEAVLEDGVRYRHARVDAGFAHGPHRAHVETACGRSCAGVRTESNDDVYTNTASLRPAVCAVSCRPRARMKPASTSRSPMRPARPFFEGLADGTPYNIVLEPGVGGSITLKIEKRHPHRGSRRGARRLRLRLPAHLLRLHHRAAVAADAAVPGELHRSRTPRHLAHARLLGSGRPKLQPAGRREADRRKGRTCSRRA